MCINTICVYIQCIYLPGISGRDWCAVKLSTTVSATGELCTELATWARMMIIHTNAHKPEQINYSKRMIFHSSGYILLLCSHLLVYIISVYSCGHPSLVRDEHSMAPLFVVGCDSDRVRSFFLVFLLFFFYKYVYSCIAVGIAFGNNNCIVLLLFFKE